MRERARTHACMRESERERERERESERKREREKLFLAPAKNLMKCLGHIVLPPSS